MIGIVIVSHSATLAEGVAELARGMAGPEIQLVAVGGLDFPDHPLGTDATLVRRAIEQVYSDSGVLVFMDLGGAVLSAEMALDMLEPEQRANVRLSDAPLVEGAVVAAVQARLGNSLEQVVAEVRSALMAKITHLEPQLAQIAGFVPPEQESIAIPDHNLRLVVRNRLGLHARPAARLVQTAGRFQAEIQISNLTARRGPVSAKSINRVALLGVRENHEIQVTASGIDALAALAAIESLAADSFGDKNGTGESLNRPSRLLTDVQSPWEMSGLSIIQGIPGSPGLALGAARIVDSNPSKILAEIAVRSVANPQAEWDAFQVAINKTRSQIQKTQAIVSHRVDRQTANIFEAHLLILDDESLWRPVRQGIFEQHLDAVTSWQNAVDAIAAQYQAMEDEYFRARAADIMDIARQVLANLLGQTLAIPVLTEPGILIAADLTPAETAHLDSTYVLGICTANGGSTAHSAILARALGIPAVVGLGEAILAIKPGTPLIINGDSGQLILNPDAETTDQYKQQIETRQAAERDALTLSADPAITRDGRHIEVAANIGSLGDALAAVAAGADAVGLFRTEFLFLNRSTEPDEEEQYLAYRAVADALAGRSLIIRTLDVGGDKPLAYINQGQEANPFLGWRAIRLCLANPEFFKVQLRAIVRVAAEYPVKVMFPMIATQTELRAAKALLEDAYGEVLQSGGRVPDRLEVGMMVEIPASAVQAQQFAPEIDFFSIGTNDLIQYTMAAERGNPRLAALADSFQPAVLKLIQHVTEAAHAHGKWVGLCGELASDLLAVPLLCGMGIDELSVNVPAIPRIKQAIRDLDYATSVEATAATLKLETPEAIRDDLAARLRARS